MASAHSHSPVWMILHQALVETVHMSLQEQATHAGVSGPCTMSHDMKIPLNPLALLV